MERNQNIRNPSMLFMGIIGVIVTAIYVNVTSPGSLLLLAGFFGLFFFSFLALGLYVFPKKRHAILLAVGMTLFLVLRLLGLRQFWYTGLLIASVIALEMLWKEHV